MKKEDPILEQQKNFYNPYNKICLRLPKQKKQRYLLKYAWYVTGLLAGEKNGRKYGMKLNIAAINAEQKRETRMIELTMADTDRIIEMAWEDRTSFEAIEYQFGLIEKEVIKLMRKNLKRSSFKMWRTRTNGRVTKHEQLRSSNVTRFKCSRQRIITLNKINRL